MTTDVSTRSSVSVMLQLNTLPELQEFCTVLSKTDMVPKAYKDKPGDILVAMLHGQEVGLPHLQALQSIAVVNGIPSIFGDAALAMVRASGKLEDFDEWIEVDGKRQEGPFPILKWASEEKDIVAFCRSKRSGMSRERITTFSVDDAKRAKLWEKKGHNGFETPWCTVPQRMLMWRARGWNLRDQFGDVLKGLSIYEEAMDIDTTAGKDGVYRPVVVDDAKAQIEDVRTKLRQVHSEREVEQKPAETQEPKPAESKPAESKPDESTAEESKDFTAADSKWKDMICYMSEDPDRAKLLKAVKDKFGASSVAKLPANLREGFLNTLKDAAKKLKLKLDL